MNTFRLLTLLVLVCLTLPVRAEDAHTPKPGSAERKDICDGLRAFIIAEYAEKKLPKPIVLKIEFLKVLGNYCVVECEPMFEDGTSAMGPYFPDMGYSLCLKRFNVGWHVIIDFSAGDVPGGDELKRIKKSLPGDFPVSILSDFWQDVFAAKFN